MFIDLWHPPSTTMLAWGKVHGWKHATRTDTLDVWYVYWNDGRYMKLSKSHKPNLRSSAF